MQAVWFVSVAVPLLSPAAKTRRSLLAVSGVLVFFITYLTNIGMTLLVRYLHVAPISCVSRPSTFTACCGASGGSPSPDDGPDRSERFDLGEMKRRLAGLIRAMPRRDNSGGAGNRPRRRRMPAVFGFGAGEAAVCFLVPDVNFTH